MRSLLRSLFVLLLFGPLVWADTGASTTTLTVTPSATSGTTITASDENSRSNSESTWANAHVHSLPNTTNFGDGTAGNKSLCADAADTTDLCLRWDDTANVWTIESNASTNDDMLVRSTGTSGLSARQLLLGDGLGPIRSLGSVGTSGQELQSQGIGSDPVWAAPSGSYKVGNFTRDMTASSGAVAYTGITFQPKVLYFFARVNTTAQGSWGATDGTNHGVVYVAGGGANVMSIDTTSFINANDGTNSQVGGSITLDTDGFTITWTKNGTPSSGTLTVFYIVGR